MMKQKIALTFTMTVLVIFTVLPLGLATTADRVLAVVNDEIITLSELEERKQKLIAEMSRMVNPGELEEKINMVENQTLQLMIEEILLSQKATELGIRVGAEEIDDALLNVVEMNKLGTIEALGAALEQEGLSLDEYKKIIEKQLKIFRVQNHEVKSKVRILEDEVKKFYDQNLDQFKTSREFHVRHILFQSVDMEKKDQVAATAQNVYTRLIAGEDFCTLAEEFSDDPTGESCGDLGTIKEQDLLPEFLEAIDKAGDADYTEPFKTKFGLHIAQITERTGGGAEAFDAVKERIKEYLFQEKFMKKRGEWIEELKKTNYIKIIGQSNLP